MHRSIHECILNSSENVLTVEICFRAFVFFYHFFFSKLSDGGEGMQYSINYDRSELKNMRGNNKDRPLLRTKSELPRDNDTIQALKEHRRADDYLQTNADENKC